MEMLTTAEQMRRCDREAINRYRLPGLILMENAGRAFVDALDRNVGPVKEKQIVVLCGKGSNGGDGYVVARHLASIGALSLVILLGRKSAVKGDARVNLDIILKLASLKGSGVRFKEVISSQAFSGINKPDIVVDAIFGTGFSGNVTGLAQKAIRWMNSSGAIVASVDIPSGVDANTGRIGNVAAKAHVTVTMGMAKIGQYVGAGRDHSGEVVVADIGIPKGVMRPVQNQVFRVRSRDITSLLPRRPASAHKYSVGKVFALAGSRGFVGAPYLCAQAAMKAGAGAVVLGIPNSIYLMMSRKVTEVMLLPLDETDDGTVGLGAKNAIEERIRWADAVVLGPGLSRNEETMRLLIDLIPSISRPLVLDADALHAVMLKRGIVKKRRTQTILTPHSGELEKISGHGVSEIEEGRVEVARSSARSLNSVVVLKGSPTVVADPHGEVYLNSTGNPGMATAGTGDVLAGVIGSLIAQGVPSPDAAFAGVFIHGMAGDTAGRKFGQRGMMAMDLLDCIPEVMKRLEQQ